MVCLNHNQVEVAQHLLFLDGRLSMSEPGSDPAVPAEDLVALDSPSEERRELKRDDIKIVYHPHSGLPEEILSFEEWAARTNVTADRSAAFSLATIDRKPWRPFQSRVDFEFAEAMQDAHMSRSHIEKMISCTNVAKKNSSDSEFTLCNEEHLRSIWDLARTSKLSTVSLYLYFII